MADAVALQEHFGIPGMLRFETTHSGLVAAQVTAPGAKATVYIQGAHLTDWQPSDEQPVLFLSAKSDMAAGKAIRGGVPVIFPWFGSRSDGKKGPSHGFARTEEWELKFAALMGDAVRLTWALGPNAVSRELGFDHFRVALEMTIGNTLTLQMTVLNDSGLGSAPAGPDSTAEMTRLGAPLVFEQAFHTYFAVSDAEQVLIDGLGKTLYLDKVDGMKQKAQTEDRLKFPGRTDRVYLDTTATCVLNDPEGERTITVEKSGSNSTVVWNPWSELSATMADMEPGAWRTMACIETANVGDSAIRLAPGSSHSMRAVISVAEIV